MVLLLTEWKQYRELDPVGFGRVVRRKRVLEGRNALDREAWQAAGWDLPGARPARRQLTLIGGPARARLARIAQPRWP